MWPVWKPNRWSCNLINEPGPFVSRVAMQSATHSPSVCQLAPAALEIIQDLNDQLGQEWGFFFFNAGSAPLPPLEGPSLGPRLKNATPFGCILETGLGCLSMNNKYIFL